MPPKAQKKPAAPKKPTKPSAKSKTGNTACSQAASNWQLAIRGKEPLDPQTYSTLAKCRAMTRTAKQADDRARMGYNLNEQGAAALKGRLQKRFDQGLITQKSRDERLKTLLAERKAKQAAVAVKPVTQTVEKLTGTKAVAQRFENAENKFIEHAISYAGLTRPQAVTALNAMTKAKAVKIDPIIGQFSFTHGAFGDKAVIRRAAGIEPAKPTDKAASLVSSVRQKPGYGVAREAAKINKVNARFLNYNRNQEYQDYIEKQNPTLEAKRLMGEASELRRKAAEFNKSTNYSATKNKGKVETQSYSSGKGTRIVGFTENATSNIHRKMLEEAKQKLTRAKELEKQPAKPVVTRKEFNREYGKTNKGTVTTQPAKQEFKPGWGDIVKHDDQIARITSTGMFSDRVKLYRGKNTDTYRFMGYTDRSKLTEPTRSEKAAFLIKERSERPITEDQHKRAMQIVRQVTKPGSKSPKSINPNKINYTQENHAPSGFLEAIAPNGDVIRLRHVSGIYKATIHTRNNGDIKTIAEKNGLKNRTEAKKWVENHYASQPQPPKPAFSRQGQLAPGRGTEAPERSQRIQRIRNKIIEKAKSVQNELRKVNTAKNKSNSPVWDSSYQKLVDRGSKAKARLANLAKATDNLKKLEPVKKVATGRGTEERKNLAQVKAEARKLINDTTVKVSSNSFYYNSHDPEKRAKTYSAGYTKDIQSNMRGQVKRAKTANDAKVILDVLKQHVTGMKTRIAAWANAESRTASWAVTGRGNFNSSRNSKRMDSAMNKSQEISDYSKGLENAVSRALLKKSDTGTAITRLAKIRTRLERRKSKLNSDKQIQTRTAVYSARGLDEFANATKEDRSQALKNSMGQLKQIDKDRKTILGRLKKITAAESNLKMQTRISRAL